MHGFAERGERALNFLAVEWGAVGMDEAGEAGRRAESGGTEWLFCIDEAVSTDLLEAVMWRMVCGETAC